MNMDKKTIAVVFGGCSTEYEVSLQSAASVLGSMNIEKYDIIMLGITRWGEWLKFGGDIEQIKNNSWQNHPTCVPAVLSPDRDTHGVLYTNGGKQAAIRIDAVFPVLHGKNGEDGSVQGIAELAGIPCVGCGSLCSAICMDKDIAHRLAGLAGIKTPRSIVLDAPISDAELFVRTAHLDYPMFVKPCCSGSSFGITKIGGPSELPAAIEEAFLHDRKVIIEEEIVGFEVGCAILGNRELTIGAVDEIELEQGFFDYTEKYTLKTAKIHMPARVDQKTAERVKQAAAAVYRALGCADYARVDLFLTPDREIMCSSMRAALLKS
jgi:D-alanine---D-serine ligase